MPDDELRQLERATSEAPGDFVLGRRYAQALERAGDRRGAMLERLRLARLGDQETVGALESLFPLSPRVFGRRPERRLDHEPIAASVTERRATISLEGYPTLVAAAEALLYVWTGRDLLGIDLSALAERWRRASRPDSLVALRGTDVVLGEGRDLILLEGDTGRELARTDMRGRILALATEHDRGAAVVGANDGRLTLLVGIDLGLDFGRSLWKRIVTRREAWEDERQLIRGIAAGCVIGGSGEARAFVLEDGTPSEDGAWRARWSSVNCGVVPGAPSELSRLPDLRRESDPRGDYSRSVESTAVVRNLLYVLSASCRVTRTGGAEGVSPVGEFVNYAAYDFMRSRVILDRNIELGRMGENHSLELIPLPRAVVVLVAAPGQLDLFRFETPPDRPKLPN